MKNNSLSNQQGFSLVELMIVVAIIGLLAAVGVPQYQKFQARARQGEAKASLSALYTAEQSFYGEWNQYSVDLKNIGFGVTGTGLRYVTGFAATACTAYNSTNGAPVEVVNDTNVRSDGTAVRNATTWGTGTATYFAGVAFPAAPASSCDSTAGAAAFVAVAAGHPNNSMTAAFTDVWSINNNKLVRNDTPGIQ
jgi:prepilin-type N-terminal cleavage/methylation domain-containing protein